MSPARAAVLGKALARVQALKWTADAFAGGRGDAPVEVEHQTVRETIELLQSLLPAEPIGAAEVAAQLTGAFLRGSWSVPSNSLNGFFRQAYAAGKAAGLREDVVNLASRLVHFKAGL